MAIRLLRAEGLMMDAPRTILGGANPVWWLGLSPRQRQRVTRAIPTAYRGTTLKRMNPSEFQTAMCGLRFTILGK